MDYEKLKELIAANGYKVADERIKPETRKTWKTPYCVTALGVEATTGSDTRPFILSQPITLALVTGKLDRAEQGKIKTIINKITDNYTMDGYFIDDGNAYETDFLFTLISKIK